MGSLPVVKPREAVARLEQHWRRGGRFPGFLVAAAYKTIVSGDDWSTIAATPVVSRAESAQERAPTAHNATTAAFPREATVSKRILLFDKTQSGRPGSNRRRPAWEA
jgi:hypothetical protein